MRAGEIVAITDSGQVISELVPPYPHNDPKAPLEDMPHRGDITLAKPLGKSDRAGFHQKRRPVATTA